MFSYVQIKYTKGKNIEDLDSNYVRLNTVHVKALLIIYTRVRVWVEAHMLV